MILKSTMMSTIRVFVDVNDINSGTRLMLSMQRVFHVFDKKEYIYRSSQVSHVEHDCPDSYDRAHWSAQ